MKPVVNQLKQEIKSRSDTSLIPSVLIEQGLLNNLTLFSLALNSSSSSSSAESAYEVEAAVHSVRVKPSA